MLTKFSPRIANSINLNSAGAVPVAILRSETFDATKVDPDTVRLASYGEAAKVTKALARQALEPLTSLATRPLKLCRIAASRTQRSRT